MHDLRAYQVGQIMNFLTVAFIVVASCLGSTWVNGYLIDRWYKWVREVLDDWAGSIGHRVTDLEEPNLVDQIRYLTDNLSSVLIVWMTDEQGYQRRARAVISGLWFVPLDRRFDIKWIE